MNPIDIALVMHEAGFRGDRLVTGLAVVMAESHGNPDAKNTTGNTPPSTDRGLWQINDHWHAEVTDECAYDPACSTREAFRISNHGRSYGPWNAFKNGSYEKYLPLAELAHEAAKRLRKAARDLTSVTDERDDALTENARLHNRVMELEDRIAGFVTWRDAGADL